MDVVFIAIHRQYRQLPGAVIRSHHQWIAGILPAKTAWRICNYAGKLPNLPGWIDELVFPESRLYYFRTRMIYFYMF